jgi:hypothetical protein
VVSRSDVLGRGTADRAAPHSVKSIGQKKEEAVCDARNLSFMVTATMETNGSFYGEDKTNAICYGVYQMEDRMRVVTEAYYRLHDEIREYRKDSGETLVDRKTSVPKRSKESRKSALSAAGLLRRHCGGARRGDAVMWRPKPNDGGDGCRRVRVAGWELTAPKLMRVEPQTGQ